MKKVLITPRSYGKYNKEELIALFNKNDIEPIFNPYGRIMDEKEMIQEIKDVDGLIVGVDPVNSNVLKCAPKLKAVAKYGVGTDNIDCDYAAKNGISVTKTMNANSDAVADFTMALMLAVARRVVEIDAGCHSEDWSKKEALDIYGKKIGVLGLGAIGRGVVKRAKGFDMEVYGFDVFENVEYNKQNNIKFTDIDTIIKECDFISLHMPLVEETKYILNKNNLKNAKENLIIINTARGGLINEDDLYDMLVAKKIYGVGIDAFENEAVHDSKLLKLTNVIAGSHTAASSKGAINTMSKMATEHVIEDLLK
ncbi:MAG: phosphoglycerate dehydrogenase [Erysipelotrichaceae bacterium]